MNGCIITDTPIAVDYWRATPQDPYRIHFLSHMHTDHTSGLSSSWRRPLYCSEITSKILRSKLQVCKSLVHILPIGQPTIIPIGPEGRETITVTPIGANHCPGAVMFLFEGYFGTILYTADFKYTPTMFSEPGLNDYPTMDTLYLDNTFNDPKCTWPSNDISAGLIENIISTSIGHSDIVIALHTLGKEELLARIAKKFQRWIVVSPKRYEMLQLLELPNVFTTDTAASNIRVVCQTEVTWKNLINWNSNGRQTIVIIPSALFKLDKTKKAFDHPSVYLVPYTSHSSYPELQEFVQRLRPSRVVPIVRGSSADVSNFEKLLSSEKPARHKLPEFLLDRPRKECYVDSGNSVRNVKINHPIERGRKRKIAQGVVFADSSEKLESASDSTHCSRTGINEQLRVSESVEPVDEVNLVDIANGSGSLPKRVEPLNKKLRQDTDTAHPEMDHDHGSENLGNGRPKNLKENAVTWSEVDKSGDVDVSDNNREKDSNDVEVQRVGCDSREVDETKLLRHRDLDEKQNNKLKRSKLAVISVKHRHNFYESFNKMQLMIKQRNDKQMNSS